ncbi:substrate-binding periplasmic protein [Salidesulfovibrio brasiliensis]|uniref:substrate-binding periplasmic protein n=1 Tax=Salidesulfovibrio brasiliensis TaxID=221711 RepID=UPI0006D13AFB|nr:transporter substrate-binding domain-containing protein [Salidesulfovibrio brasiliensis]
MRRFLLAMVMLALMPTLAFCEETQVYSVATEYWPPFRVGTRSGDIVGLDVDILDEAAKRMNVQFRWHQRPWGRCLYELEQGIADIMTGVAWTEERAQYALYTDTPYYTCSPRFYALKENTGIVKSYDDLKGLTIGFTRDSAYFPRFDKDTSLMKRAGNNEEHLIRMVENGRWNIFVGTDCQVERDLALYGLQDTISEVDFKPEHHTDLFLAVSMRSPLAKRMDELNATLREMLDDGTIRKMASYYFDSQRDD